MNIKFESCHFKHFIFVGMFAQFSCYFFMFLLLFSIFFPGKSGDERAAKTGLCCQPGAFALVITSLFYLNQGTSISVKGTTFHQEKGEREFDLPSTQVLPFLQ